MVPKHYFSNRKDDGMTKWSSFPHVHIVPCHQDATRWRQNHFFYIRNFAQRENQDSATEAWYRIESNVFAIKLILTTGSSHWIWGTSCCSSIWLQTSFSCHSGEARWCRPPRKVENPAPSISSRSRPPLEKELPLGRGGRIKEEMPTRRPAAICFTFDADLVLAVRLR